MRDLSHKKINRISQKELLEVLGTLKELTVAEACEVLKLNSRRYYRWRSRSGVPDIKTAWNRITPQEESAQDVINWVAKFKDLYNNHPHSSLGYVCPNDEHAGLGNIIREKRKENLLSARQKRLAYYHCQRKEVSEYRASEDRGSEGILEPFLEAKNPGNGTVAKIEALEAEREGDFRANSLAVLCQNR